MWLQALNACFHDEASVSYHGQQVQLGQLADNLTYPLCMEVDTLMEVCLMLHWMLFSARTCSGLRYDSREYFSSSLRTPRRLLDMLERPAHSGGMSGRFAHFDDKDMQPS